jgi:hypothetical protein
MGGSSIHEADLVLLLEVPVPSVLQQNISADAKGSCNSPTPPTATSITNRIEVPVPVRSWTAFSWNRFHEIAELLGWRLRAGGG